MQNKKVLQVRPTAWVSRRLVLSLISIFLLSIPVPAFSLDVLLGAAQRGTFNNHTSRILCRLINSQPEDINCELTVARTDIDSSDQVHIITNIRNGALDLGIIDSAVQYEASNGSGRFEFFDINFDNLRSLFSLNGTPFTVLARQEQQIETFSQLKSKRVNVGNPGSAQRTMLDDLLQASGWTKKDFQLVEELPASQSQDTLALCFGTVDAVVRSDIHPNAATKHMVDLCNAGLVDVSAAIVEKLIAARPYYVTLSIPGGIYQSNAAPIDTFGLVQTLITTEDLDEETVYTLVKLVFEQLDRLRSAHAAFGELRPDSMHNRGLTLPLHAGALRYYRERGWVQ